MEGESAYYCDYLNSSNSCSISPCDSESNFNFKVFLPVLYILVFVIGFAGNGLVVCVLLWHRHRSSLTDLCLLNLSVSDLLFLLTLPLFAHYSATSGWVFGGFLCHLSGGLHSVGFLSSVLFMTLMTVDRYVLIRHAQRASRYRSRTSVRALCACAWALSICLSLPAFIFTQEQTADVRSCMYDPEKQWLVYNILTTNILGLVLPLSVMVACYSRIIPTLLAMRSAKRHRVVKLIVCIVAAFFLFWAPYNITLFLDFLRLEGVLRDSCALDTNLRLSTAVTEAVAFSHCCLNPIIYAFAGQKFLKRSVAMLRTLLPGSRFASGREGSSRVSSVTSRASVTSTVV